MFNTPISYSQLPLVIMATDSFLRVRHINSDFRFDCEYEFDYQYHFFAFEFVMFSRGSPAILLVNRRMAIRFDPIAILQTTVNNLVTQKGRARS